MMNRLFPAAFAALLLAVASGDARAAAPANDNFAAAKVLSGPVGIGDYSNVEATPEAGEPAGTGNASLWFAWTATSGSVTFSTLGCDFKSTLTLYNGTALHTLAALPGTEAASSPGAHEITFPTTAGTVYDIAVGGDNTGGDERSGRGKFMLSWVAQGASLPFPAGTLVMGPGTTYCAAAQIQAAVPVFRLLSSKGRV